ncbi:MAG TPA: aromatic ring-hydroxylating dioxygenase subunit alpha [Kofleriaceae bacterium]|nr:aromatic ring-hydroxylating dioxygenase subunit alpha [Kofleriaceae bacterium]
MIAASASVAAGACLPIDVPGVSLILTRGERGEVRGLANACRHRATRLVDAPCSPKALVCPYHGWTYDLRGSLIHAPHGDSFVPDDRRDLVALPVSERHGMVWLGSDIGRYLGGLDRDFAAIDLEHSVLWRSRRATLGCNWKLVIEAFLDGYHFRMLHRDTIYKFFLDATAIAEPVGPHIRAATARRGLLDASADLSGVTELRTLATPSYILFPGTIVVFHPDFVSVVVLHPLAADRTDYEHFMLVPAARAGETEHWTRSWAFIEETLFQKEDLWACEQVQRGLAAGTTDALLFGELETAVRLFHGVLAERLSAERLGQVA